jgi:hypothetical protein
VKAICSECFRENVLEKFRKFGGKKKNMSKKIKMVLVLVVMLSLAGSAQAYQYSWCFSSGDWGDAARWDVVPSPTLAGEAFIYNNAVLNVTTPGQGAFHFILGYDVSGATVNVAAGIAWTITYSMRTGMNSAGTADLNVYGTANIGYMTMGKTSASTINVYDGGTLNITGQPGYAATTSVGEVASAAINLKGTGNMVIGGDGGWNLELNSGRGHIDIEAGSLKMLGDYRTQLQSYVDNGWITSHGGYSPRCSLAVTFLDGYTYVKTTGCTCVSYLPADLNHDCYVDMRDLAFLAQNWLVCINPADANCVQ